MPVQPKPNGYEEIVAAARALKPLPAAFAELSSDQIHQIAQQNLPAIEQMRKAFALESGVTLEIKKDWQDRHELDLKDLKRLAVALGLEAKAQLLRGHTNEAARGNVEVIRLAQTLNKGGILLDGITSLAVETVGTASLQVMLPQLDATCCRAAARALEEINAKREQPETILATERAWSARRFGLIDRLGGFLARKATRKRFAQFIERSHQTEARTQRLMLRLAVRAYEMEQKQQPAKVSDLIPAYLKTAPHDSETGKEIQEIPSLVK